MLFFILLVAIIVGSILAINTLFTINFTTYFVICGLSMLFLLYLHKKNNKSFHNKINFFQLLPWSVVVTFSIVVTLNYLHPNETTKTYTNVDYQVLALQEVCVEKEFNLVDSEKPSESFFDNPNIKGDVKVNYDNNGVCINYNISNQPLFIKQGAGKPDSLLNKESLVELKDNLLDIDFGSKRIEVKFEPSKPLSFFTKLYKKLTFQNTKDSVAISIKEFENGRQLGETKKSSFNKQITLGYSLYDILYSGVEYSSETDSLLNLFRHTYIISWNNGKSSDANISGNNNKTLYLTYEKNIEGIKINGKYNKPIKGKLYLNPTDEIYMGIGSSKTKLMSFSKCEKGLVGKFSMPCMYNFPSPIYQDSIQYGQKKYISLSTSIDDLTKSDVKEAFLYNLFKHKSNSFSFNGYISYRIGNSNNKFEASLFDNYLNKASTSNSLKAKNGATFIFQIIDLRKNSPITGTENFFVSDLFILSFILIVAFIVIITTMLLVDNPNKGDCLLGLWTFAFPMLVIRLYLLWRIAVFPPVSDISKVELLRYRLENSFDENAMWMTIFTFGSMLLFTFITGKYGERISYFLKKTWSNTKIVKSIYCVLCLCTLAASFSGLVFGNIALPVLVFFVNEFISIKCLSAKWRIYNFIITFVFLFIGDPGYAIMFIMFACVYFLVVFYSYLMSLDKGKEQEKRYVPSWSVLILFIVLISCLYFSPNIVSYFYDATPIVFEWLTVSKISISFVMLCICLAGSWLLYLGTKKSASKFVLILAPVIMLLSSIIVPMVLEHNQHFKYRAFVHTKNVSQVMETEDVTTRDSERLLEASQNQWFIEYHNNRGDSLAHDSKIMALSPHFRKGVTWNTQISDVIVARYIVGEISSITPFAIILLCLAFFAFVVSISNSFTEGRYVSMSIVLLLLMQMTFVWMAATNRMIFFGQDFPFLSQNARITMFMFAFLLMVIMALQMPDQNINKDKLTIGFENFATKKNVLKFSSIFLCLFVVVAVTGNNYKKLYNDRNSEDSNTSEFNLAQAMNNSRSELQIINEILLQSNIEISKIQNNADISSVFDAIDKELNLTNKVEKLKEDGLISKFTWSMYSAFQKGLKRSNNIENIIHVRKTDDNNHLEFALNNGFYSLKNPESDIKSWKGNIYSDIEDIHNDSIIKTHINGIDMYSIPKKWVPKNNIVCIADYRDNSIISSYDSIIIHKSNADYLSKVPVLILNSGDMVELMKGNESIPFRYGREDNSILVKNMIVNGHRKFIYPLKEESFLLKDLSEMIAVCNYDKKVGDAIITIDKELTRTVFNELKNTDNECSVVALDGTGAIRLLADYKGQKYMMDPNNEEEISQKIIENYLNPSPRLEQKLFGNLNLCYMTPGPGSSLKPLTYAAVTSQSSYFDWENLILLVPNSSNSFTTSGNGRSYYNTLKYGPDYTFEKKHPFKSIAGDEKEDGKDGINNVFYLKQSSNYYNALVSYLGYYESLADTSFIFKTSSSAEDFPRFRYGNSTKIYTFKSSPNNTNRQLLFDGLQQNLKLDTKNGLKENISISYIGNLVESNNKFRHIRNTYPWIFPQNSSAYTHLLNYNIDKKRSNNATELDLRYAYASRLKQYTLGSDPLHITPLKMAEMYGKLFSLNSDFESSLFLNNRSFKEPWVNHKGETWSDAFKFYKKNLYIGMKHCALDGTAKFLSPNNFPSLYNKGLYVYAKTGTLNIGITDKNGNYIYPDDRMLAVIITNKEILECGNPKDYKFYVVYFRFAKTGVMKFNNRNIPVEVLRAISESNSFKKYFN